MSIPLLHDLATICIVNYPVDKVPSRDMLSRDSMISGLNNAINRFLESFFQFSFTSQSKVALAA